MVTALIQNVHDWFNPPQNSDHTVQKPDGDPENAIEDLQPKEDDEPDVENILPTLPPTPGQELSVEVHLAHFGGYATILSTEKAKQSHAAILKHNTNLEDHTLLLSKLRERDPDEDFDFTSSNQVKALIARLKKMGVDTPEGTRFTKKQCDALMHKIEGSSRAIDVKLKMEMNKFNEHSRMRDTTFEMLKSCQDKLHSAKRKAIDGIK